MAMERINQGVAPSDPARDAFAKFAGMFLPDWTTQRDLAMMRAANEGADRGSWAALPGALIGATVGGLHSGAGGAAAGAGTGGVLGALGGRMIGSTMATRAFERDHPEEDGVTPGVDALARAHAGSYGQAIGGFAGAVPGIGAALASNHFLGSPVPGLAAAALTTIGGAHLGKRRALSQYDERVHSPEAAPEGDVEAPKTAALRIYAGVKVADDLHEAMRQHLREEQQSNWRGTATVANGAAGAYLGSHVGKMMGRPGLGTAIGAVGGAIGGRMGWNAYQGSRFDKRLPAETAQAPHAAPKTAGWFSRSPAPAAPPPPPSKPPLTVQQFEQLLQRGNPGVRVARSSYDPNVLHTVENHPEHGLLVHGFSSDILDEAANDPNPEARWGVPPTDHGVPYGVEGFNSAGYKMASRLYGVNPRR